MEPLLFCLFLIHSLACLSALLNSFLLAMLEPSAIRPDLVVYLMASPKVLIKRIRKRNHAYERKITQEYLEELVSAYSKYFFAYDQSPLLVVNTSQIDFVNRDEDFEQLVEEIINHERGVKHFIPLGAE